MKLEFDSFEAVGSVRRPIQCEGIKRGPERMTAVGVSGSVNPQFSLGDIGGFLKTYGPSLLSLL